MLLMMMMMIFWEKWVGGGVVEEGRGKSGRRRRVGWREGMQCWIQKVGVICGCGSQNTRHNTKVQIITPPPPLDPAPGCDGREKGGIGWERGESLEGRKIGI